MSDLDKMLHVVASRSQNLDKLMANGRRWTKLLRKEGLVAPGMRILDLGAGLGRLSIPLQAMGCTVHAVDSRADMVAHLRAAGIEARQCNGVPDMLEADSYDLVLAMHVFQHQGRHHVEKLVQRISHVSPRLLFTLPTVEAYGKHLPPDYVVDQGTTERYVDCERSFTWHEADVPGLFHSTTYTTCVRAGRDNKLWHAHR